MGSRFSTSSMQLPRNAREQHLLGCDTHQGPRFVVVKENQVRTRYGWAERPSAGAVYSCDILFFGSFREACEAAREFDAAVLGTHGLRSYHASAC